MLFGNVIADYRRLMACLTGRRFVRALRALAEPSLHIMLTYRYGRLVTRMWPPFRWILLVPYWVAELVIRVVYNISISRRAEIGPGFVILHPSATVIFPGVKIGANVTIGNQVVICPARVGDTRVATIENDVMIGAGAKILGAVRVNHHSVIGANAVVVSDVPVGAVVGGVPGKVVKIAAGRRERRNFRFRRPRRESNVRICEDRREGVIHV
ncbi:MAG: hypothetical protein N2595_08645 [bacterium]|nr:hypothetical protein [bacterium]